MTNQGFDEDLMAPTKLKETVAQPLRPKERRIYLIQGMSAVNGENGAAPGKWYVGGDPNAAEGTDEARGYAAKDIEVGLLNRDYSRRFDRNNELICRSEDTLKGFPSDKGQAAPYLIPQGQDCQSCRWLKKATAEDPEKNGFCSFVREFDTAVQDSTGKLVKAKLSLRNTAGPVADEMIGLMKAAVAADGSYTPIKVVLGSTKPPKKPHFIPTVTKE